MARNGRNGRGRGRGGRGRGRGRGRFQSRSRSSSSRYEYKFHPHGIGAYAQTATFQTVKDHIIQTIQKTFKNGQDVAESLRELKKKDLKSERPVLEVSSDTDADKKKIEDKGLEIEFDAKLKIYLERVELLRTNMTKAYGLIIANYCSTTMQTKIEEHPEYESKILDNPIELLDAILILMHDPVRAKYPFASLTDAISHLVNIKQVENENLLEYMKRFKQQQSILKSHLGGDILDKFVEKTQEYRDETDTTKQDEMKSEAYEKWMAYLLIRNSDQRKYGTLTTQLVSQYSMGQNQYPKTFQIASDILSQHRFDSRNNKFDRKKGQSKKDDDTSSTTSETSSETSFAQLADGTRICYCCGKKGHWSPQCPEKDTRPKERWVISQSNLHLHMQAIAENKNGDNENASLTSEAASIASLRSGRSSSTLR